MKNIIYIAAILLVAGCTEKIPLDLNDEGFDRLVVDGLITDRMEAHTVNLTKTTSYFENQAAPRATGATVTISDGTTTHVLSETAPGVYQTSPNVQGEIGKTYTLTINYEGEEYRATSLLDTVPHIDSVATEWHDPGFGDEPHYDLFMWVNELAGVGNYYMFKTYRNGESLSDTLFTRTFVTDEFVDGNYIANWQFDYIDAEVGDSIDVEIYSISKEMYDVFLAIMLETEWSGGLFDAPPANVPSNVSNGALGVFGAAAVDDYQTVVTQ